ncbi:MAG: putative toxin-antitoxin system toxin component, PIN family [Coriobacteriales bacterium]|jgi:putative PIN family toxin of toxin-antitoxin system|nr:putative toxin-antitoxin system toxin component, PIN family [Coriobacteriales bacterium]
MINVVIDTNVLVATLLTPQGDHAKVLMTVLRNPMAFNLVVSSQIMDEYRDVCGRSVITLRGLKQEADALIALVESVAEEIVPKAIPELVYPDEKDKPFLEAAVYTSGILVSNNTKDYPFAGVRILKAGEFLSFTESKGLGFHLCKAGCQTEKIPFEIALDTGVSMRDAMAASERIWKNSVETGTDEMTPEEIDAEIATSRAERKMHGTTV